MLSEFPDKSAGVQGIYGNYSGITGRTLEIGNIQYGLGGTDPAQNFGFLRTELYGKGPAGIPTLDCGPQAMVTGERDAKSVFISHGKYGYPGRFF